METGIVDLTPYKTNLNCNGKITVPTGSRILLKFESFYVMNTYLEKCYFLLKIFLLFLQTEGGSWDYLDIFDGASSSASKIGRFGDAILPAPIFSSGNSLYLKFKSDGSVTYDGFKAYFMRGEYLS